MAEVLALYRESEDRMLVESVDQAVRWRDRLIGLLGRERLDAGEGLWITPCNSVHTVGMRFDIDVLFLDRELRIVKAVSHLKPWRLAAARAHSVIELSAGAIARHKLHMGDRLRLTRRPPFEHYEESLA